MSPSPNHRYHGNGGAAATEQPSREGVTFVIRHSKRLDDDKGATWSDQGERPHDPPIADHELPKEAARQILAFLLSLNMLSMRFRLVCSPFRRCMETAKIIMNEFTNWGITFEVVFVDRDLSEVASKVPKAYTDAGLPMPEGVIPIMPEDGMREILGPKFLCVDGKPVDLRESPQGSMQRFADTVKKLTSVGGAGQMVRPNENEVIIMVTHGDCLNAVCDARGKTAFEVPECSWVAVDLASDELVGKSDALLWMDN